MGNVTFISNYLKNRNCKKYFDTLIKALYAYSESHRIDDATNVMDINRMILELYAMYAIFNDTTLRQNVLDCIHSISNAYRNSHAPMCIIENIDEI